MKKVERNLFVEESGFYYVIWRDSAKNGGAQHQNSLRTTNKRDAKAKLERLRRLGMNWERFAAEEFGQGKAPDGDVATAPTKAASTSQAQEKEPERSVPPQATVPPMFTAATPSGAVFVPAADRPGIAEAVHRHFTWKTTKPTKWRKPMEDDGKRMLRQMRDTLIAMCRGWEDFKPYEVWNDYRHLGKAQASLPKNERPKIDEKTIPLVAGGNHMASYLRSVVPWLVDKEWIPPSARNDLKDIVNTVVAPRNPALPSTQEILDLINQLILVDRLAGLYVHLLATTGLRRGRWNSDPRNRRGALGLSWKDVNWEKRTLRAVMKGGAVETLPLIDEAIEVLRKLEALTGGSKDGRIFPIGAKRAASKLSAWASVMDLEITYLHALRHYFASVAIIAGVPIPVVAKLLGHKDGGILLMRTYSHLLPGAEEEAARKLTILMPPKKAA